MYVHQPVLLREVLEYLGCAEGGVYVDGTVGEGGHSERILEKSSPTGRLIGIDLDEHILQKAAARLERFGSRVQLIRNNFKNIKQILNERGLSQIDGFLADLGISSYHLESPQPESLSASSAEGGRGFSFQRDEPLDMRLDRRNPLTAAMIVNQSAEEELARIIWEYGEERWSRKIARAVCSYRKKTPISTTGQLAEIVRHAVPAQFRFRRPPQGAVKIDPATRTFQALRIAVNQELEGLDQAIRDAVDFLRPGGRICIISFHSLEDRIVKRCFRSLSRAQEPFFPGYGPGRRMDVDHETGRSEKIPSLATVKILTPKPVMATQEEIEANPRARSAKLRVAEKCGQPQSRKKVSS